MNLKEQAGVKAAAYVKEGMVVGLGTGSTAYYMVEELGRKVKNGLNITGITTSDRTREQAESLGIPLKNVDEVDHIDVTIDGADEVSNDYHGIKGGGGALLYEKIVANYSKKVIWIVDSSKLVDELGAFPLPVEVIPVGSQQLYRIFNEKGFHPAFRLSEDGEKYRTDSGHWIIDLQLKEIKNPHELATWLDGLTGVVEHGLFLDCVNTVVIGREEGPEVLETR